MKVRLISLVFAGALAVSAIGGTAFAGHSANNGNGVGHDGTLPDTAQDAAPNSNAAFNR